MIFFNKAKFYLVLFFTCFIPITQSNAIAEEKNNITNEKTNPVNTNQYQQAPISIFNMLKVDGVKGTSDKKGWEDYISLNSWSTGMTSDIYQKGVNFQDFYITLAKSSASTDLLREFINSKVIPNVIFTTVYIDPEHKKESKILFRFTMHNVKITSFQMGGSEGGDYMLDQVSLNYESGTYEGDRIDKEGKSMNDNSVNFSVPKKPAYNSGQY